LACFIPYTKEDKLLKILYNLLEDKGYMYVEDFYLKKNITNNEKKLLAKNFHANHLVPLKTYKEELNCNLIDLERMQSIKI